MKYSKLLITAPILLATLSSAAEACRVSKSIEDSISSAYASKPNMNVAIVKIIESKNVKSIRLNGSSFSFPYQRPWRAAGTVTRMALGAESPEIIIFDGAFGSCGSGERKPRNGDSWVIYYEPGRNGGADGIVERFPFALAQAFDPRIQTRRK